MKISKTALALIVLCAFFALESFGLATRKPGVSMLVAPARYTVLQVSQDILAHRPAILVSYRDGGFAERDMFVWDGSGWIAISADDFAKMNFVRRRPAKIVFIGDRADLGDLIAAADWCEDVELIENLQTTALLNSLGRTFNFSGSEWSWFAQRYGCDLDVLNRAELKGSWYDQRGSEFLARERAQKESQMLDTESIEGTGKKDEMEIPPAEVEEPDDRTIEVEVEELIAVEEMPDGGEGEADGKEAAEALEEEVENGADAQEPQVE